MAGLLIGGFYQALVIFGLHWAVILLVASDIASQDNSYLNAIISTTIVVSFVLTYMVGFSDADLDEEKTVKKVRLGRREPAGT